MTSRPVCDVTGRKHAGRVRGGCLRGPCSGAPVSAAPAARRQPHQRQDQPCVAYSTSTSTLVDTVVINGVDVTDFVNGRDPYGTPLRAHAPPVGPGEHGAAWVALEDAWAREHSPGRSLSPKTRLHESVNNGWSFRPDAATSRVRDGQEWFTAPILGGSFHPMGLPNSGSVDFPWPGLDYDLTPSVSEALAVRVDRAMRFGEYLKTVAAADLTRPVDVLENGTNPVQECIYTVFEEEFWHNRYAQRPLAQLEAAENRTGREGVADRRSDRRASTMCRRYRRSRSRPENGSAESRIRASRALRTLRRTRGPDWKGPVSSSDAGLLLTMPDRSSGSRWRG